MSGHARGDAPIESGIAADRVERLTKTIRDQTFPNLKPRDSATLILIDRTESVPKVLLGRRHERHRFMPGKFIFPGGRIEPADRQMATLAALRSLGVADARGRGLVVQTVMPPGLGGAEQSGLSSGA